jgi:hypothetical protein
MRKNVSPLKSKCKELASYEQNNIVHSLLILSTLILKAIGSSALSVLTRTTRRHIPEDGIHHSHRREYLKCYIALTGWAMQRACNVSPARYELGSYIP